MRKWIVLPFENLGHARDVDWLHDASVNLLLNDLSQWQDVRVVDDERVAGYMRATPLAHGPARLSLESALAVAWRAGAGNLVMGDYLRLGQGDEQCRLLSPARSVVQGAGARTEPRAGASHRARLGDCGPRRTASAHRTGNDARVPRPVRRRRMLLRADLAAALGFRGEARTWYRRFIELWVTSDAECRPIVTRARSASERLNH